MINFNCVNEMFTNTQENLMMFSFIPTITLSLFVWREKQATWNLSWLLLQLPDAVHWKGNKLPENSWNISRISFCRCVDCMENNIREIKAIGFKMPVKHGVHTHRSNSDNKTIGDGGDCMLMWGYQGKSYLHWHQC